MTVGKNEAFAAFALVGRGEGALRHVPYIDKIIAALYAGGEFSRHVIRHKLYQVIARAVVRPENPRRVHDYRVQPFADVF